MVSSGPLESSHELDSEIGLKRFFSQPKLTSEVDPTMTKWFVEIPKFLIRSLITL